MDLIYIENQKKVDRLAIYYKEQFSKMFGDKPPNPEYEDLAGIRWLVNEYSSEDKCKRFIQLYLTFDDEWTRKQGYPLRFLKKSITGLLVQNSEPYKENKPVYVVGLVYDGTPQCSNSQKAIGKFKPVLWDVWIKQSIKEKLQFPAEQWGALGNDVDSWIEHWQRNGFLPEGSHLRHNPLGHLGL